MFMARHHVQQVCPFFATKFSLHERSRDSPFNITIFVPGVETSIIATDADPALIKAVYETFLKAVALLCQWHIQKNVAKHCKSGFATDKA
jgi:hypothetical protein